jgi:undecaprenyl-diphosphatase
VTVGPTAPPGGAEDGAANGAAAEVEEMDEVEEVEAGPAGARETVTEVLGGTPPSARRPPASPLRSVLPAGVASRIDAFDRAVDTAFDQVRGRRSVDRLFYTASALGDFSLIWHLAATATALRSPRHEREALRLAVALGIESALVNGAVKSMFRRTRPPWEPHAHHQLRRPRSSSFPSGHASSAFLAAGLLGRSGGPPAAWWYAVATVVAASRVHVGIHHASDVMAGALLGAGLGRVALRAWPLPAPQAPS